MRQGKRAERKKAQETDDDFEDIHFGEVTIPEGSSALGQSLRDLDLRNKTGVSVIRILRDTGNVNNPKATESFKPGDRVVVNGSVGDIELFKIFVAPAQETV